MSAEPGTSSPNRPWVARGHVDLEVDGDTLTGKMSGAQGEIELEEGKVDGGAVSPLANLTQPMPIKIELRYVDGDAISGSMSSARSALFPKARAPELRAPGRRPCGWPLSSPEAHVCASGVPRADRAPHHLGRFFGWFYARRSRDR